MIKYYITKGYLGKRLFRWDQSSGTVIQIVVEPPVAKKGRPHMFGIYRIVESTFRGQYLWFHGKRFLKHPKAMIVRRTTEKIWNHYFNIVSEKLKNGITE
jgi:hypothetical protein